MKRKRDAEMKILEEHEMQEKKREAAMISLKIILKKSAQYSDFFKYRLDSYYGGNASPERENPSKSEIFECVSSKLKYFVGVLKNYQLEGVVWLKILFENGVNGILADEMGLGKTVQIIALLSHLYQLKVVGPFLIVVPLSTLSNWESEFKRFAPKLPVIVFYGSKEERPEIKKRLSKETFTLDGEKVMPIILTTYEYPTREQDFLEYFTFQYIIIDEGHRIKNHKSQLSVALRTYKSKNKLLLTGTPLQNNLIELWALLNFLLPDIFINMDVFQSLFLMEDIADNNVTEDSKNVVSILHKLLAPFVLRRLKCDVMIDMVPKKELTVYCPITEVQKRLYQAIIEKDTHILMGKSDDHVIELPRNQHTTKVKQDSKTFTDINNQLCLHYITMQSPMTMFKKVVDHPYLVHFPLDPNSETKQLLVDSNLVNSSGKLLVLDALLPRLKKGGHKVLLFSTMVMLLDLIEEYIIMRGYKYRKLDGRDKRHERDEAIEQFNTDPEIFIFLISTRAGGLGLNLVGADTVILYDRDWNPQIDVQAQDRSHRIGQTKPVVVYSLVIKNTIEDKILRVVNSKRCLEKFVIQNGKFKSLITDEKSANEVDLNELKMLINSTNTSEIFHSNGFVLSNKQLDHLLDRSDLHKQMSDF